MNDFVHMLMHNENKPRIPFGSTALQLQLI